MTRPQIKEALLLCSTQKVGRISFDICRSCPYYRSPFCQKELFEDAAEAIGQKTEERQREEQDETCDLIIGGYRVEVRTNYAKRITCVAYRREDTE